MNKTKIAIFIALKLIEASILITVLGITYYTFRFIGHFVVSLTINHNPLFYKNSINDSFALFFVGIIVTLIVSGVLYVVYSIVKGLYNDNLEKTDKVIEYHTDCKMSWTKAFKQVLFK